MLGILFRATWRAYFFPEDFALHKYCCLYFARAFPPRFLMVSHLSPPFVFYFHVMTVMTVRKGDSGVQSSKKKQISSLLLIIGIHKTTIVPDNELLGEAECFPRLTGHIS